MQQAWSVRKLSCLRYFTSVWAEVAATEMEAGPFRVSEKIYILRTDYNPLAAGRDVRNCLSFAVQCGPSTPYPHIFLAGTWCQIVVQVPFSEAAVGTEKEHAVTSSWPSCSWTFLLEHSTVISNSMFYKLTHPQRNVSVSLSCVLNCHMVGYLPAKCSFEAV